MDYHFLEKLYENITYPTLITRDAAKIPLKNWLIFLSPYIIGIKHHTLAAILDNFTLTITLHCPFSLKKHVFFHFKTTFLAKSLLEDRILTHPCCQFSVWRPISTQSWHKNFKLIWWMVFALLVNTSCDIPLIWRLKWYL